MEQGRRGDEVEGGKRLSPVNRTSRTKRFVMGHATLALSAPLAAEMSHTQLVTHSVSHEHTYTHEHSFFFEKL